MASILKIDELRGLTSAGDITVTSEGGAATQSLQQGLVKCFVYFDQYTSNTVQDSFNTSSVLDQATGIAYWNVTNGMSNVYGVLSGTTARTGTPGISGGSGVIMNSTTQWHVYSTDAGTSNMEDAEWSASGHGDLA